MDYGPKWFWPKKFKVKPKVQHAKKSCRVENVGFSKIKYGALRSSGAVALASKYK
jgi:hypothetical protein